MSDINKKIYVESFVIDSNFFHGQGVGCNKYKQNIAGEILKTEVNIKLQTYI